MTKIAASGIFFFFSFPVILLFLEKRWLKPPDLTIKDILFFQALSLCLESNDSDVWYRSWDNAC